MNATEYAASLLQNDSEATDTQKVILNRARQLMSRQLTLSKQIENLDRQRVALDKARTEATGALNTIGDILFELRVEPPAALQVADPTTAAVIENARSKTNGEDKTAEPPPSLL